MNRGRRQFFATAGCALGAVAVAEVLPRIAKGADELPHLATNDPTAQALKYTEDASTAQEPHRSGEACANCNFFHGGATGYGPCDLFTGKAVAAAGWCAGYTKKA